MQDRFKFRRPVFDFVTNEFQGFDYFDLSSGVYSNTLPESPKLADDKWEQCTGLKDANGNLIYENDVIKLLWNSDVDLYFVVEWYEDFGVLGFELHETDEKGNLLDPMRLSGRQTPDMAVLHYCEIIGNIHTATVKDGE